MSVLVATSDGYHIFTSSGKHLTALEGHRARALAPGPDDTWVAVVDRREVWQHAADGTWSALARADVDLSSLVTVAGVVFAGTYDARLLRLDGGAPACRSRASTTSPTVTSGTRSARRSTCGR